MSSFKMNFATIEECPSGKELISAINAFGIPDDEEFAVLNCTGNDEAVYASIVHCGTQDVNSLDKEAAQIVTNAVDKAAVYPIGIFPDRGVLEVYGGGASGIDHIAAFLSSGLGLPTIVTQIDLDIPSAIEKLKTEVNRFQLKGAKITDYAHNSYMCGAYSPKFIDTESGLDFLREYAEYIASSDVSFWGKYGRVTVKLTPKAQFNFSVKNEDDKPEVQAILRKLIKN